MKVKLSSRELWKEYYAVLSAISVIASLVFLFLKIPDGKELLCCIGFLSCLVIAFLIVWYRANHIQNAILSINNSTLEIGLGDIFEEEGFKIIAFNEFFDTQVDDVVISKNTLNGKYITRLYPQASELDGIISADTHASEQIVGKSERKAGKSSKYKLGTIVKNGEYFLLEPENPFKLYLIPMSDGASIEAENGIQYKEPDARFEIKDFKSPIEIDIDDKVQELVKAHTAIYECIENILADMNFEQYAIQIGGTTNG